VSNFSNFRSNFGFPLRLLCFPLDRAMASKIAQSNAFLA
jgi:hypothetical protein